MGSPIGVALLRGPTGPIPGCVGVRPSVDRMDATMIAVVGAGTMGAGIAQTAAQAGHPVTLIDRDQETLDRAVTGINAILDRNVEKGRAAADEVAATKALLVTHTDTEAGVTDATMVIEAVFEDLELKQQLFQSLDQWCPADVILASNTSTLPITKIASLTEHPERVIGTHYFSPVPLMRLVEVVRGEHTSDAVAERTVELCRGFGKSPILIADVPGFIVNRFLCLLYNEAANMIDSGVATADRYDPSPLLRQMVAANKLGRKTGQGFYNYI